MRDHNTDSRTQSEAKRLKVQLRRLKWIHKRLHPGLRETAEVSCFLFFSYSSEQALYYSRSCFAFLRRAEILGPEGRAFLQEK